MKGLKQVFSFTLTQQLRSKGYRIITILLALILFLLPACIMPAVEKFGGKDEITSTDITSVYTVDLTNETEFDFNILNMIGNPVFNQIAYTACNDIETAQTLAEADPYGLVMVLEKNDGVYDVYILRADETELTKSDAENFEKFMNDNFQMFLISRSGLSAEQLSAIYAPTSTEITHGQEDPDAGKEDDPYAGIRKGLSFALPYLNIMILYFMVLYYGQGVANNVIMEKTSKLMDTFLVSTKPSAMIFGKVFAIVLSSILQFALWVVSLIAGFIAGTAFVRMINPDTDMALIKFFDIIGEFSGLFSIPGIILSLLMIFGGFFLYCAIASIGGSFASKPEDLSSTNTLFTLILIVSFFCTIYTGAMTGDLAPELSWLDLVPFTAILVTPSRILLGNISIVEGLLSFGILIVVTLALIWLAGRVYKMMSLYKGNPPKPQEMIAMIKNNLTKNKTQA